MFILKGIISKLMHKYRNSLKDILIDNGIDVHYPIFILHLVENEGKSLAEIGAEMMFDKAHISRMIAKFEEEGYVEKRQDQNDKRCSRLYPTEKCIQTSQKIKSIITDFNLKLLRGVSQDEQEIIYNVIQKINSNLQEISKNNKDILC